MIRVALVVALVGCRSGNFMTVHVDGIPCNTVSLDVDVSLAGTTGGSTMEFSNADQLGDGASSFALDLADRRDGTIDVLVTARMQDGTSVTASGSAMLPQSSLVIDLPGPACATGGVDADTTCWISSVMPTNFAPCERTFPVSQGPLAYTASTSISTDDGAPYTFKGTEMMVLHVDGFMIPAGVVVMVSGTRPLLIASEGDVMIGGEIIFDASKSSGGCPLKTDSVMANVDGPGGFGGSYGSVGGRAGDSGAGDMNSEQEIANGNETLIGLRSGCEGQVGGAAPSTLGGAGGTAGGAIQISSTTVIAIAGSVLANGGAGGAGQHTSKGSGGGGGGGSGGAIVVEAPTVSIGGLVCAVGGGAGQGGGAMSGDAGVTSPNCFGGRGGDSAASNGGPGGAGADSVPAVPGMLGGSDGGGGGGGGGAGRIRITAPTLSHDGVITPDPVQL
jgi:hypothetical protein